MARYKPAPPTCPTCGGRHQIWTSRRNRKGRSRVTQNPRGGRPSRWTFFYRGEPNLGSVRVDYWYACQNPWHRRPFGRFHTMAADAITREHQRTRRELTTARPERSELEDRKRTRTRTHREHQGKDRR